VGAVEENEHEDALRRSLVWDGCFNVRDLGGLETASGGRTRRGVVVRADNVRRLTAAGWQSAFDHGIRRVVDLRFENEVPGEPDAHVDFEVHVIPLRKGHDPEASLAFEEALLAADDLAPVFASSYVRILEDAPDRVGEAIGAVADAGDDEGVIVHCFAGKDRTGIVSALLLSLVGVPDELIAADYAASDPGVDRLSTPWFASARNETELKLRRRVSISPRATMLDVLSWVHETAGGPHEYLRSAGVSNDQLQTLRTRLVEA
jgi:protein tyrosine/serine phosphatase